MGKFRDFISRFRRDEYIDPDEVDEYYEHEEHRRAGVAWLLGAGTLIITIVITMTLFYGVRFVYRQFFTNNDDTTQVTPTQTADEDQSPEAGSDQDSGRSDKKTKRSNPDRNMPSTGDTLPATGDNISY